uniref:Phosphotransferase n=1 Tax=Heterorhabditis bacteriophora TaxID=37862 RepID=A0A1I7WP40_HETBA
MLDFLRRVKLISTFKFRFEKMISGMYMGEVVRVVLEALARDKLLFDGDYEAIAQHGCFPTKFISEIERLDNGLDLTTPFYPILRCPSFTVYI